MYTLGIWDGHDAGVAVLEDDKIVFAINEERLTKRKLEVGYPVNSISFALSYLHLKPTDFDNVAASTSDSGKTMSRYIPQLAKNYYMFRRRKVDRPRFEDLRRYSKYATTEGAPNPVSVLLTKQYYRQKLEKAGFKDYKLSIVDHHAAHAATAAYPSGLKKQLVVTMDGVGDGLSGTISIFNGKERELLSRIPARDSLGLFYEQATNLMGMRELEDEGKVMALSNYATPVPDEKNKLLPFFSVDGMKVISRYNTIDRYNMLKKVMWGTEREEFAYMVQATLEKHLKELVQNSIDETGVKNVSMAGGVFSNVKANMHVKEMSKSWFVFPHMGDGGLAMGSAMQANYTEKGIARYKLEDVYLGPEYSENEIQAALKKSRLGYEKIEDPSSYAGDLISSDRIGFWYQGRMEYGPRALGNRSIITSATNKDARYKLNMCIKNRSWFQPFCPSLLAEESERFFEDAAQTNRFMTMGYRIRQEYKDIIVAVKNVDDTARPQMLESENPRYRMLIKKVKDNTGLGIILNTSFNMHGSPLVNTPEEAVQTYNSAKPDFMIIGDYLVEKK
ncbi:MAG: hypothetical protein HGA85_03000 [Nanoarchaeota archaeon]|nr:hypothetical protein [Nanoarchaeota archaeon]